MVVCGFPYMEENCSGGRWGHMGIKTEVKHTKICTLTFNHCYPQFPINRSNRIVIRIGQKFGVDTVFLLKALSR